MEFPRYKRTNQLLKSLLTFILLYAAIGGIMLMTGGRGTEPLYKQWGVSPGGYIATFGVVLFLFFLWNLLENMRSTGQSISFKGSDIYLRYRAPFKEELITQQLIRIDIDYHSWMKNNEEGNVYAAILRDGKIFKFLVKNPELDEFKVWQNEHLDK